MDPFLVVLTLRMQYRWNRLSLHHQKLWDQTNRKIKGCNMPRFCAYFYWQSRVVGERKESMSSKMCCVSGHYITDPNNTLLGGNPSNLPYICIKFDPLQTGNVMIFGVSPIQKCSTRNDRRTETLSLNGLQPWLNLGQQITKSPSVSLVWWHFP